MTEKQVGTIVIEAAIAVHRELGSVNPLRLSATAGETEPEVQPTASIGGVMPLSLALELE